MDVTAMQYPHFTQALTNEQAARQLYTVRALREDYGLTVEAGVQSDITGNPWRFADILPASGISFLTMAINMHRALAPEPRPGGFWWEGPAGGRLLVWNGLFYVWGRSLARIGDWRFIDRFLPQRLAQLEGNGYAHDFLYAAITHPTRVDNGPPDPRMPDFVRDWNAQGRTPRMEMVTVSGFGRMLRERHGDELPTVRGDWTDWWTNGYGADARLVGVNRGVRHVFAASEDLEAWLSATGRDGWNRGRAKYVQDKVLLAEDLVWGAFSSYYAPDSLYSRSQYAYKLNDVYTAAMECHDLLARASHRLADTVSTRGEDGVFNLGDLEPEEAYPPSGATDLLVFNALPWDRDVIVEEPELRGNTAPVGILEMFFPRDVPWGGVRPIGPVRRVVGRVPGLGYAFLPLADAPADDDLVVGPGVIENAHYRVRIDPATGGLAEWFDKDLGHDFAGEYQGWRPGQYVYEWIDDPRGRDAQFVLDFSRIDCGIRHTDTPYVRESVRSVTVGEPVIAHGRATISVEVTAKGIHAGTCTFVARHPDEGPGGGLELRQGADARRRVGLLRVPVQPGRPVVHAGHGRRGGPRRGGADRRLVPRLVPGAEVGVGERRRAHRRGRPARLAARPARRRDDPALGVVPRAGRPERDGVAAEQPLGRQLPGRPARRDGGALPPDDPRGADGRGPRRPVGRRAVRRADRDARPPPHRRPRGAPPVPR